MNIKVNINDYDDMLADSIRYGMLMGTIFNGAWLGADGRMYFHSPNEELIRALDPIGYHSKICALKNENKGVEDDD